MTLPRTQQGRPASGLKARVDRLLNDPTCPGKRRFDLFIAALIVVSVGMLTYDSLLPPGAPAPIRPVLLRIDGWILGVFLVEYLGRLWVAEPRLPSTVALDGAQRFRYAVAARLEWMLRPLSLIDLVSILPLFPFMRSFRVLRLLRLLRLARILGYAELVGTLAAAVRRNALLYAVTFAFVAVVVLLGSFTIFVIEHGKNPQIQTPFDAMWWSVVTITTVGYGDISPVTSGGRLVAFGVMLAGMFTLAAFAGVISQTLVGYLLDVREERLRMSTLVDQTVVLGWSRRGLQVVEELRRLEPDREVVVMAPRDRPEDLSLEAQFIKGDPGKQRELDKVRLAVCRSAVVLADDQTAAGGLPALDAGTALVVYTVRSYERELPSRGVERTVPIHVTAELMDPENLDHLRAAGADDVVETARIGSNLVAHASARPGMGSVFAELLSWWGQQVDIGPVPEEVPLPLPFRDVCQQLHLGRAVLVIGIVRTGRVELNPAADRPVEAGDHLVFLHDPGRLG